MLLPIGKEGELRPLSLKTDYLVFDVRVYRNLRVNDLEQQGDETIEFMASLLEPRTSGGD